MKKLILLAWLYPAIALATLSGPGGGGGGGGAVDSVNGQTGNVSLSTDEIGEGAHSLQGRLWVNGELKQDANTRDLVLDIPGMIEMASSVMTLYPGDIVASGTPAGVGPIKPGDKVRIEFERVGIDGGEIENVVDDRQQRRRGIQNMPGVFALFGIERAHGLIAQKMDEADDVGERRAQFIRDVMDEILAQFLRGDERLVALGERALLIGGGGHI